MKYEMTDCELLVYMTMVWMQREGKELTMADITEYINGSSRIPKSWKAQTVSTFLARLRKKGCIGMHRKGRVFVYDLHVDPEELRTGLIRKYADLMTGGDMAAFCRMEPAGKGRP